MNYRNVAIIAHVDHGKTTLVDKLLHQCHVFQAHEQITDRVMDSMDLERERGITITSKNTAVVYEGVKINIVDTPGHADFGGEVERVLSMVEGALLLVDASEGPLPQTRFVLRKAMEEGLEVMVVINKIDRPDARIDEVLQEIYDLFIDLDADEHMLDFPVIYASAKAGHCGLTVADQSDDMRPLLQTLIERIPAPSDEGDGMPQLMVTNLDYDPYVGRLALGRLRGGPIKRGAMARWFGLEQERDVRVQLLYTWSGLRRHEVEVAEAGDIVALAGIEGITVGDTVAIGPEPKALPRITVDEPTIGMMFSINNSPFAGREGKFLTSRQIRERLQRELLSNVSIRVDDTGAAEQFMVWGRGELQLAILIEQMRREGFELTVSRPQVIRKEIDGKDVEPWERVYLDVPDEFVGAMTQQMASRKGVMEDLQQDGSGRAHLVYVIPSRGLIGFRGEMLTSTRGTGVINSEFAGWLDDVGSVPQRLNGALIADRTGKTTTYALYHIQPRGSFFVGPQEDVYEGMVVGQHVRENDLNVNIVRMKHLTNHRASGAEEKQVLTTPRDMTLEAAIEWIADDERVEVTPTKIRVRKRLLSQSGRSIRRGSSLNSK